MPVGRLLPLALLAACGGTTSVEATVARVIDGDTVELEGGERVRYLLVDTPESTGSDLECFGPNAKQFNTDLVEGKTVELTYDVEREDMFGRTLAWVTVNGQDVNRLIIERGFGCVLYIPPNGADRRAELEALEDAARAANRGLWGACPSPRPC